MKLPRDLLGPNAINASNHTVTIKARDRDGRWKESKIWFVTARSALSDLPVAIQDKWVRGNWGAGEGCYFTIWDSQRMVIPFAKIPARWWDAHIVSIDYGYGRSAAAAFLHVMLQDGRIVTMMEIVRKYMPVYEFAAEMIRVFDLAAPAERRRNVVVVYQDPANKPDGNRPQCARSGKRGPCRRWIGCD